jgi:hypothetical protein
MRKELNYVPRTSLSLPELSQMDSYYEVIFLGKDQV